MPVGIDELAKGTACHLIEKREDVFRAEILWCKIQPVV